MGPELQRLLEHLERILDPVHQNRIAELYKRTLDWQPVERLPLVLSYPLPADLAFKPYPVREVLENAEKMLYNELVHAFDSSIACRNLLDDDMPCTIRGNFGTVVMASMFGANIEQVDDNLPWVRPFDAADAFEQILDCDPCDFSMGWCPQVVDTYKFYNDVLSDYPTVQKSVIVVLPDLQGPLDTAEQLRGSAIYEDFYRNQDALRKVMCNISRAQSGFAKQLQPFLSDGPNGYSHQHMAMIPGRILIRNDCAINLSPRMYREQVAPHDAFVLEALGGGGIHCCGRFQHLVEEFLALPDIKCIDFGQPELNDIDALYNLAAQKGIPLVRIRAGEQELVDGRVLAKFPTGITLVHHTESLEKAQRIMKAYKKAFENGGQTHY